MTLLKELGGGILGCRGRCGDGLAGHDETGASLTIELGGGSFRRRGVDDACDGGHSDCETGSSDSSDVSDRAFCC